METIKQQVAARHRCIFHFVRCITSKEPRQYYDGTVATSNSPFANGFDTDTTGVEPLSMSMTHKSRKIIRINLSDCLVDDEVLSLIVKMLRKQSCLDLESLNLQHNLITDRGARRLAMHLQKLGRIRHLDLRQNKITAAGIRAMASALQHSKALGPSMEHVYVKSQVSFLV